MHAMHTYITDPTRTSMYLSFACAILKHPVHNFGTSWHRHSSRPYRTAQEARACAQAQEKQRRRV